MHWADINAALYKADSSPSHVGKQLGFAVTRVSRIIRGIENNYDIAAFIASVTGIPLNKLFPDGRYRDPKGGRWRPAPNSQAA